MDTHKKICFVISPIGDEGSETRSIFDKVFKHLIKDPAEQMGYEAIRADHITKPGIISVDVFKLLVSADIVIADLSQLNVNVFYELAFRDVQRKPAILIINSAEIIPFDIVQTRVIKYNLNDLDSAESCRARILESIQAIEQEGFAVQNAISIAVDLSALKESSDAQGQITAQILEEISSIREEIHSRDLLTAYDKKSVQYYMELLHELTNAILVKLYREPPIITYDNYPEYRIAMDFMKAQHELAKHLGMPEGLINVTRNKMLPLLVAMSEYERERE